MEVSVSRSFWNLPVFFFLGELGISVSRETGWGKGEEGMAKEHLLKGNIQCVSAFAPPVYTDVSSLCGAH